jgi:hypothetical protein
VLLDDLAGDPPPTLGGVCRATVTSRNVRASDTGLVRVRMSCRDGCFGTLDLFAGANPVSTRSASFNRGAGSKTFVLRLEKGALRRLRERGSRLLTARPEVLQRGGAFRRFPRAVRVLAPR